MGRKMGLLPACGTGINTRGLHADAGQRGFFGNPLGAFDGEPGGVGVPS